MNVPSKILVATVLVLLMSADTTAQNSSLMRQTGNRQGYRSTVNAPLPPLPPTSRETTGLSAGHYAAVAQTGQLPAYDGGGYDGDSQYGSSQGANLAVTDPYDPGGRGYDPYQRGPRPVVSLNEASWTYQPAPPVRTFRKNDVVTIRVDEITRMMAEGYAENRKRTLSEAILTDWIRLKDFRLRPDPQDNGDPAIAAESNSNYRAESAVESRESLTFNIAATVVDIRANGNLVLEARKAIRVNDNLWETSLSGICRAEDIAPDNVVLSKDLIDLEIRKEDRGHLRDSYSRGWLQRLVDRFGPF